MNFQQFLTRVIDEGIKAAQESYKKDSDEHKRQGAVAGFNSCRGLSPDGLLLLLKRARRVQTIAYRTGRSNPKRYWRVTVFYAEVEWVCNVVSAVLRNQGLPTLISPTARGMLTAAKILGVSP